MDEHGCMVREPVAAFTYRFLSLYLQTVDAKKLEKAEAKLKAKHDRRNEKDSQKGSSPLSVPVRTCKSLTCTSLA